MFKLFKKGSGGTPPADDKSAAEGANPPADAGAAAKPSWSERLKAGIARDAAAEGAGSPQPAPAADQQADPTALESILPGPQDQAPAAYARQNPAATERPAAAPVAVEQPAKRPSWTDRLKAGLAKTRANLGGQLNALFRRTKVDEDLLEELESTLILADVGMDATRHVMTELRGRIRRERIEQPALLQKVLQECLLEVIRPLQAPLDLDSHKPFVIMIAGVNGAGKTTSIGKLAKWCQGQGKSVLLAAGDTFRAAAREQLETWGARNNVSVVAQEGGDPAAVIFDAVQAARARGIDVVLADTAGRLPTQLHLMEEIAKVRRVIQKADPSGPHEVLLVLDANIGQNALAQVKAFDSAIGVTGLIVTKLDGTAKGGVVAAIARQRPARGPLALRFIGVGEGIDDLQPFSAEAFVEAMFEPQRGAAGN
ncbi:MAG: signal recognition particle-docking protein FtsY [Rhodocyclaceae bacterium]|nr:signal recognition particle-docking protein FtsY [Rhodocyclaceae bacterium]MBX3671084.1 signal recognition particle-docking protein FtsY [Rhodocyclaceae bacterium]